MTGNNITHPHVLPRCVMLAGIVLVTIVAYLNIFQNGFAIDDHVFIGKYHPTIAQAFRGSVPAGHEGVYRPVRGLLYTAYYQLFGTNPFFYHLHSLVVHLTATALVFFIISVIARSESASDAAISHNRMRSPRRQNGLAMTAGVAALLFGLHPVHTESITYIASSMDMTGIVFFLASFLLYVSSLARNVARGKLRWGSILSIILALLAFFTYEMTLTLPILLVLYELVLRTPPVIPAHAGIYEDGSVPAEAGIKPGMTQRILPYFFGAAGYLCIRFFLLGIISRGVWLAGSVYLTALTMTKVLVHYLWVTIFPVHLTNNHIISPGIEAFVYRGYRTAAILSQSILDPEILFLIGVIGGIGVIGWNLRKTMPLVSFGVAWFFVTLLPVMGLVPQGSVFNERMLYLPSVGFVMVVAYAFVLSKQRLLLVGLVGLVGFLYGVRTITRNLDWKDDVTLWQKDAAAAPAQNAYAYFALGNAYYNRKELERAAWAYQRAVAINPGFAVGYASLWRVYRDTGDVTRANAYYRKADEAEPGFWTHP